jgi:hypothetical protein
MEAMDELRDALDDAIRRAYCEPVRPPVTGEPAGQVRALWAASVIENPDRMRHLADIQAATWAVVEQRVEDEKLTDDAFEQHARYLVDGEEGQRHAHYARAVGDAYAALTKDDLTPNVSVEAVEAAREALADMIVKF